MESASHSSDIGVPNLGSAASPSSPSRSGSTDEANQASRSPPAHIARPIGSPTSHAPQSPNVDRQKSMRMPKPMKI